MARRNPSGIVDDIFLPAGKKVVHEVRTNLREIIRKSAKAEQKNQKAQQILGSKQARHKQEYKAIEKRLNRNMDAKATTEAKKRAGARTAETGKQQLASIKGKKTPRAISSAKNYQKDVDGLISATKKRFPSEDAYQRALKEEARDLRKAKNVTSAQKNVPTKKAPVKRVSAKKAPAKKQGNIK